MLQLHNLIILFYQSLSNNILQNLHSLITLSLLTSKYIKSHLLIAKQCIDKKCTFSYYQLLSNCNFYSYSSTFLYANLVLRSGRPRKSYNWQNPQIKISLYRQLLTVRYRLLFLYILLGLRGCRYTIKMKSMLDAISQTL